MKNIISFTIFTLLLTDETTISQTSTTPSSEATTPATTSGYTTVTDTIPTETTVAPTTETSPVPSPTTPVPSPTTPVPSPTTPVPSPTTSYATTTELVSSTKPPAPPVPDLGSWNTSCIRADLKIRFMIHVDGHEDYIALSPNATSDGSNCANVTQELILTDSDYVLSLTFEKDADSVYIKNISFSYSLPGVIGFAYNDTHLYKVKLHNSYLCTNTESIALQNVTMEVFQIHVQAFGTAGVNFGLAEECEADNKVNDIVPIAVGCALLALVVVVLIAYFVGRRRSRQKGYQSV